MTGEMIVEIANQFLILNNIEKPHMNCRIVSNGLQVYFENLGVKSEVIIFDIDTKHYNGDFYPEWVSRALGIDVIEHYCLKIGWFILDATASQFNDPNGNQMPRIYFGVPPDWYQTES